MSYDIEALEALVNNDAALRQAQQAESAVRSQQFLSADSALPDARLADELRMRRAELQAMERLRSRGVITTPSAAIATEASQRLNAPRRIRLPSSVQLPSGRSLDAALGAVGNIASIVGTSATVQEYTDRARETVSEALPDNLEPYWDRVSETWERVTTPTGLGLVREASRSFGDITRLASGEQPRSATGAFVAPLLCNIFGIGCPQESPEGIPNNGAVGDPPPFTGGQSPGVSYRVTVLLVYESKIAGFPSNIITDTRTGTVRGPVSGLTIDNEPPGISVVVNGQTNYTALLLAGGNGFATMPPVKSAAITNIVRADGQPDTGGNPPPATYSPAPAPAIGNRQQVDRPPGAPQRNAPIPNAPAPTAPDPATQPIRDFNQPTGDPGSALPPAPTTDPLLSPPAIAPNAPPQTSEPDDSPTSPLNPLLPLLPLALVAPFIPGSLRRPNNNANARTQQPTGGSTTTTFNPTGFCSYDSAGISGKVDAGNTLLGFVSNTQLFAMQQQLDRIDNKLGPAISNGGISGFLQRFRQFMQIDRIINLLTLWTTIHNAFMLSNAIKQTLFSSFDLVLQLFGNELKDDEGNDIDTSGWVSEQIENFFKSIFGDETVEEVQRQWKRWNRIYQATANILNALQGMIYSVLEGMEAIGKYVALIGNAVKRFGVVAENAYNWMNPNFNFRQNRFFRTLDGLQEGAEAIETVASSAVELNELRNEISEQKTALQNDIADKEGQMNTQEADAKGESIWPTAPRINPEDEIRPTTEEE